MDNPEIKKPEAIFKSYLEREKLRKTKERFAILSEIYSLRSHFSVDSLHDHLLKKKYSISLATVYNTIEHLLACQLIRRHRFDKHQSTYEAAIEHRQHDHLICNDCGHVLEFCDPRIQQIQAMMGQVLRFDITGHSLHLYGQCLSLKESGKCIHLDRKKIDLHKT